ncbi:MAG: cobalt-precorrin-6A reductase [Arachnia sp.]
MILLLGGTADARTLAEQLVGRGHEVTSSLAGAVAHPRLPSGKVRIGGFGGVAGLTGYLRAHHICAVVDATHPFAARMTSHAQAACAQAKVPLLRYVRASWATRCDADQWHWADDLDNARGVAERQGQRTFLAIGRQGVEPFLAWQERYTLLRVVDPPELPVPACWDVIRARGPFTVAGDLQLMRQRRIDVLVAKDAGGAAGVAKLDAAARLQIPVVMLRRPPIPEDLATATTIEQARGWLEAGPVSRPQLPAVGN